MDARLGLAAILRDAPQNAALLRMRSELFQYRLRGRNAPLPADRTPDGCDNAVLRGFVKISMHRQTDDLLRKEVADRQTGRVGWKMPVRLKAMQRLRIVDGGWNALRLERRREGAPAAGGDADGVLRPNRGHVGRHSWHLHDIGQMLRIAPSDPVAFRDFLWKDLELLDQHRGLDGVEPRGKANPHVVVAVGALAM